MAEETEHTTRDPFTYRIRIMSAVVVAELICLGIVLFWPIEGTNHASNISFQEKEITQLQAPIITRQQSSAPPPPPTPKVPIPVPDDQPIKEEMKTFDTDIFSDSIDSLSVTAGNAREGNSNAIAGNPAISPRLIRIEEPTFENKSPEKVDIYVKFLVGKNGTVEDASIEKILMYDKNGKPTIAVESLDNKQVIQKTLSAALNWKFYPAKENGHPVRAYSTQIFTVDY